MNEKVVKLAEFNDTVEAELARSRLCAAGIPAFLDSQTGVDAFPGLSWNYVQLHVHERDLDRAHDCLTALENELEAAEHEQSTAIQERHPQRGSPNSTDIQPRLSALSPADPVHDESSELDEEEDEEELAAREDPAVAWTADGLANRAWRASFIGLLVFPVILHLYSLWLLYRLSTAPGELSSAGRLKVYGAIILDGLILVPITMLILLLLVG